MIRRILIVEANDPERAQLELLVAATGIEFIVAADAEVALAIASETTIDLVLCDPELVGIDDFPLISQLSRRLPDASFVLVSPLGQAEISERAVALGALDVLTKPVEAASLALVLARATDRERLRLENRRLAGALAQEVSDGAIVAASDAMIELLEHLERAAGFQAPALVVGEQGTGKEVLARALHQQSTRRAHPFIKIRCRGRSESQLEMEIFGSEKTADSGGYKAYRGGFSEAQGGVLFFDEITALPARLQTDLLRALEEEEIRPIGASKARSVDVRILAASARDPRAEADAGHFSTELLARLDGDRISVPPLRERREDIPLLVDHFLAAHRNRLGEPVRRISDEALEVLIAHDWPGNIRELENLVERAVILTRAGSIEMDALPASLRPTGAAESGEASSETDVSPESTTDFALKPARQAFEARFIRKALEQTGGNRTHAAKLLAISHRALLYKLKDYGIND